jgi:hypothetical protein
MKFKLLEKQEQTKPKPADGEIISIRAEINEIETKKPHKASMKQKAGCLERSTRSTNP